MWQKTTFYFLFSSRITFLLEVVSFKTTNIQLPAGSSLVLTPGPLCFFQNRSLAQSEFTYLPWGHFVFTLHYCKVGGLTARRCNASVTSGQMNTFLRRWAARKWTLERMKGGATNDLSNRAALRQKYMKVRDHNFHNDTWSFGTCCQAAHMKAICSSCWVNCALKANEPLQGLNGIQPRPPLPDDLGSVVLFRISVIMVFKYVQTNWAKEALVSVFILNKMLLTVIYLFVFHSMKIAVKNCSVKQNMS